jgi:hypothetical protein
MVSPTSGSLMARSKTRPNPRTRSAKQLKSNTKKRTQRVARSSGETTKQDSVLGLLQAKDGTTIVAISKATGWQPHSVQGFFAGVVKKKLGLTLESEKTKSGHVYRIVGAKTSAPSQVDRFGDLDAETLKVLKQAARQEGPASAVSKNLARLDQRRFAPPPGLFWSVNGTESPIGSWLCRTAMPGTANPSTVCPRSPAITGTKWNGPRFFGLRDRRPQINAGEPE